MTMFNILTPEQKKKIHREYLARVAVIVLAFVAMLEVLVVILFIPIYKISKDNIETLKNELQTLNPRQFEESEKKFHENIDSAKTNIQALAEIAVNRTSEIIEKIIAARSGGIRINSIQFINGKKEVVVKGVSGNRDGIVLFEKNLNSGSNFKKVEVPISNFARGKDINFSIKIIIE